ncbi:HupE/UreJ family protein [Sphingomonas fennica]|uniref:HupE/UreJ family protein n=1 Tax=Edaphosphingomonas fennica TaxID=114404 RepID=A0A2T4HNG7_9SPHN|nr:HupE/UreJ family protein [Sphingomonas fennica]PTD17329.1 hypothetical protein CV103_17675 [Sphingomonas fennica]
MFGSIARLAALALAAATIAAAPARADIFLSGEFSLARGEEPDSYEFTAAVPEAVSSPAPVIWPEGCRQASSSRQTAGGRARYSFEFTCDRAIRTTDVIQAPWKVDGASFVTNIMGAQVDRSLTGDEKGVAVPIGETAATDRPVMEIARGFLAQGVLHIWLGWDHLAFVLCLCLLARGRELIGLVTAFTLGHSVSLAMAFFELVNIPIPPVEAAIALSIAFMAREALHASGHIPSPSVLRRHMTVVSLFGLLHGLGFASALGELGVSRGERVPSLIFFNIGVEAGQLIFVAAVTAIMAGLRTVSLSQPVRKAALYGVGTLGAFWMVERATGFGLA